jgi:hypothetical protein
VYQVNGSLDEAVAYFEAQNAVTYTKLSKMEADPGYWSQRR